MTAADIIDGMDHELVSVRKRLFCAISVSTGREMGVVS